MPARPDRRSLLLGTALASTLLAGSLVAPAPAIAQTELCSGTPPSNALPIVVASPTQIVCNNPDDRTANATSNFHAIDLQTINDGSFIRLDNSGALTAERTTFGEAIGILAITGYPSATFAGSFIDITNSGDIVVSSADAGPGFPVAGILGLAWGPGGFIDIDNNANVTLSVGTTLEANVVGVGGTTFSSQSHVDIENRGDVTIDVTQATGSAGYGLPLIVGAVGSQTNADGSPIEIVNVDGDLKVAVDAGLDVAAFGMFGQAVGSESSVRLENRGGTITVTNGATNSSPPYSGLPTAAGMLALTDGSGGFIDLDNDGTITVSADWTLQRNVVGLGAFSNGSDSGVDIESHGDVTVTLGYGNNSFAVALGAATAGVDSDIRILNKGGNPEGHGRRPER